VRRQAGEVEHVPGLGEHRHRDVTLPQPVLELRPAAALLVGGEPQGVRRADLAVDRRVCRVEGRVVPGHSKVPIRRSPPLVMCCSVRWTAVSTSPALIASAIATCSRQAISL
jgi:hypothetical protein